MVFLYGKLWSRITLSFAIYFRDPFEIFFKNKSSVSSDELVNQQNYFVENNKLYRISILVNFIVNVKEVFININPGRAFPWKKVFFSPFLVIPMQEDYEADDEMGKLECGHFYHIDCIKQWLARKNICPICKTVAAAQQWDSPYLHHQYPRWFSDSCISRFPPLCIVLIFSASKTSLFGVVFWSFSIH